MFSSPRENIAAPAAENEPEYNRTTTTSAASESATNKPKFFPAKFNNINGAAQTKVKTDSLGARAVVQKERKINEPKTEAATEFIALSYLPASESGQIISVKVPRSVMVALGVTTDTERSRELVKAEVVIGDDGAARAIRFIKD